MLWHAHELSLHGDVSCLLRLRCCLLLLQLLLPLQLPASFPCSALLLVVLLAVAQTFNVLCKRKDILIDLVVCAIGQALQPSSCPFANFHPAPDPAPHLDHTLSQQTMFYKRGLPILMAGPDMEQQLDDQRPRRPAHVHR